MRRTPGTILPWKIRHGDLSETFLVLGNFMHKGLSSSYSFGFFEIRSQRPGSPGPFCLQLTSTRITGVHVHLPNYFWSLSKYQEFRIVLSLNWVLIQNSSYLLGSSTYSYAVEMVWAGWYVSMQRKIWQFLVAFIKRKMMRPFYSSVWKHVYTVLQWIHFGIIVRIVLIPWTPESFLYYYNVCEFFSFLSSHLPSLPPSFLFIFFLVLWT